MLPGTVAFFAVQPKFMNVHIRVSVDMVEGEVDVLLTSNSQMFLVQQRHDSAAHNIRLDQQNFGLTLNIRDYIEHSDNLETILSEYPEIIGEYNSYLSFYVNHQNRSKYELYNLRIKNASAEDRATFVTLGGPQEVLLVQRVRSRLVVSIPDTGHDLRSSKFYLLVYGAGPGRGNNSGNVVGNLFFRQDQLHIDLFVFFSVFFSCFFLFLSFCVVVWKLKLTVDMRSARRRHAVEMTIMAQRPFARQLVVLDTADTVAARGAGCLRRVPPSSSPLPCRQKRPREKKLPWAHSRGAQLHQVSALDCAPGLSVHDLLLPPAPPEVPVTAVSVEPTEDALAAVTSVLVQVPGPGRQTSLQIGSVLTTCAKT